jgi:hypothetical protein
MAAPAVDQSTAAARRRRRDLSMGGAEFTRDEFVLDFVFVFVFVLV